MLCMRALAMAGTAKMQKKIMKMTNTRKHEQHIVSFLWVL
jgi:hypothetical protein